MDTEPKIVGRENRPHMNALVHRTFGYGPLEVTRSSLLTRMRPMLFAKHVISLALGWSTGRRCTDIPAQRQGEAMLEGARVHTTLPATLHQWRTRPSSNSAPSSIYAAPTGASSRRTCTNHFRRRLPRSGR